MLVATTPVPASAGTYFGSWWFNQRHDQGGESHTFVSAVSRSQPRRLLMIECAAPSSGPSVVTVSLAAPDDANLFDANGHDVQVVLHFGSSEVQSAHWETAGKYRALITYDPRAFGYLEFVGRGSSELYVEMPDTGNVVSFDASGLTQAIGALEQVCKVDHSRDPYVYSPAR